MTNHFDILVVGGGAAGFFTAINAAEKDPKRTIAILERGKEVLTKVRISGGGRCNVTHACFAPNELVKHYPRGEKELRGPFHTFASGDTIEWFKKHGVELKIEQDGRMFPVSDSSQTIIDCFLNTAKNLRISVLTGQSVQAIFHSGEKWKLDTTHDQFSCDKLVMAAGSSTKIWDMLQGLGHTIVPPVPSLFTFNIKDNRIQDLSGISAVVSVAVNGTKLQSSGPMLITHWGLSGPAVLKLSAWGARILAEKHYRFSITINWLNEAEQDDVAHEIRSLKMEIGKKSVGKNNPFGLSARLWERLLKAAGINPESKWAHLNKAQIEGFSAQLTASVFEVTGKSTFKEEFVTAGGVDLKEVNFKTMESKILPSLYLAGEILNIDAITGGFNFQNAWTGGFLISNALSTDSQ